MKELLNLIENANTIAIFGHIRPDGDCVGSCLGLYNYIQDNYKKNVTVFLQEIPSKFHFLQGADLICKESIDTEFDLGISLDCGDRERHGEFSDLFGKCKTTACLDHHRSNIGFGDYFYCDADASSASEVLFRHLDTDKISLNVAECLYLGIVHDTGVFKYSACKEETMVIAGKLLSKGVNAQKIIDDTFYRVTYDQNLLTGQALLNSQRYLNNQVIMTCITLDMFEKFHATKDDTDGIVDKIRVTDGVEVAIFVYESKPNVYKFSVRSNNYVDVSKIAVSFGGGGHIRAAGFEMAGEFEESMHKILDMIQAQL